MIKIICTILFYSMPVFCTLIHSFFPPLSLSSSFPPSCIPVFFYALLSEKVPLFILYFSYPFIISFTRNSHSNRKFSIKPNIFIFLYFYELSFTFICRKPFEVKFNLFDLETLKINSSELFPLMLKLLSQSKSSKDHIFQEFEIL